MASPSRLANLWDLPVWADLSDMPRRTTFQFHFNQSEAPMCRIALSVLIAIVFNDSLPAQTSLRRPRTLAASSHSMQSYVDANQISGAVTLVAHKGKIVQLDAVGMADIEAGRRMQKPACRRRFWGTLRGRFRSHRITRTDS